MRKWPLFLMLIGYCNLGFTQALDSAFSTPTHMTDQQAKAAESFRHDGQRAAIVEKDCKTNPTVCDQDKVGKHGQVLMHHALEDNIGRLYSIMFGAGALVGQAPQMKVKNSEAKSKDYCIYLALGYEAIAGIVQQTMQQEAAQSSSSLDPQKRALVNLREMHKARQRTSTYQATAYGTTATCYAVRATGKVGPQLAMDKMFFAKMAAAGGLATLYGKKALKHKQAVKLIDGIISKLDNAEKCDPWTGTTCFCNEPSSSKKYAAHYQEVCVLNKGDFEVPKAAFGCGVMVNGAMTLDRACRCQQTNTCFKGKLTAYNPQFNMGKNFMDLANKGFEELSSGEFDEGRLNKYNLDNAAYLGQLQGKLKSNLPSINLNDEQKSLAESLAGIVPPAVAAMAVTAPAGSPPAGGLMGGAETAALEKLPENLKERVNAMDVQYKQGGGQAVAGSEPEFTFPGMPGQEKIEGGSEVIGFAEQAVSKADVSNAPETAIFDIISNRYRRSAWEKFKLENE
jgi:hypothetical protein